MIRYSKILLTLATAICCAVGLCGPTVRADTIDSTTYGNGSYGMCDFGSCSLTLTSSASVVASVVPSASGACTVQSGTVTVLTDNPTGYNVTMAMATTATALVNGSNNIPASTGTAAVPVPLATNSWGYRIDGLGGFGAGPTSAQNSSTTPVLKFAGVPANNLSPATVDTGSGAANPAVSKTVWYGVCSNTSQASGSYSATVIYTATTT